LIAKNVTPSLTKQSTITVINSA